MSLETLHHGSASHHGRNGASQIARRYDYVIVGGGSAGCVVARRLLDDTDATVLVLEAGRSDEAVRSISNPPQWLEHIGSPYDWAYHYAPGPHVDHHSIPLALGKVLGGSGSINAMTWARGHRADYDGWAQAGNPGWDFESVLPLFKKSEDWEGGESAIHGAGGPIRVERPTQLDPIPAALIDAGRAFGMPYLDDMNVPEPEGVGRMTVNVRGRTRCSPSLAYLWPVMGKPDLTVVTEAQVVALALTGTRCAGVEFILDGELHSVAAAREVILCAGAIHTPRLLMLSGIGPCDDLARLGIHTVVDLPGVGRNLQDHPLAAGLCFEARHPLPPRRINGSEATGFWRSRAGLGRPDLMFLCPRSAFVSAEVAAQQVLPPDTFSIVPALVRPLSRGHLRLTTADLGSPLEIQPNFLSERADVEALMAGIDIGCELASQRAFRDLIRRWVVPPARMSRAEREAFARRSCSTYFHPVGTCAMGSGTEAVVDAALRVRGVEGLRIADASVMPTITSANTHAPAVMIGEFASRLLRR